MNLSILNRRSIAILRVLDGLRNAFYWIPSSKISEKLPFSNNVLKRELKNLVREKAVSSSYISQYNEFGYRITEKGLDYLSVWDYMKHGVIDKILTKIGTGKESEIYSAISPEGEFLIIKFHRYYKKEFRKIKKSLAYLSVKWRIKNLKIPEYKIDIPRAKAQVEYFVLDKLYNKEYPVPEPVSINRHSLVMKMFYDYPGIPARSLSNVKLKDPLEFLREVLIIYGKVVNKEKIVHGDLSQENILVNSEGEYVIIDWPQAVPLDFKGAKELLRRDYKIIIDYFVKKYKIRIPNALF